MVSDSLVSDFLLDKQPMFWIEIAAYVSSLPILFHIDLKKTMTLMIGVILITACGGN